MATGLGHRQCRLDALYQRVALVAEEQKTLDPVKLAKALENFKLPPEIALMPYDTFYRAGDHQLMPTLYVGNAVEKGSDPEDLFHVARILLATALPP